MPLLQDTKGKLPAIRIPGKLEDIREWFEDIQMFATLKDYVELYRAVQLYTGNGHVTTNIANRQTVHHEVGMKRYPEKPKKLN